MSRRYTVGQVGGSGMIILEGDQPVAMVYNRPARDEERIALELAAAPTMAEALEELLLNYERDAKANGQLGGSPHVQYALALGRAALAAARGEPDAAGAGGGE